MGNMQLLNEIRDSQARDDTGQCAIQAFRPLFRNEGELWSAHLFPHLSMIIPAFARLFIGWRACKGCPALPCAAPQRTAGPAFGAALRASKIAPGDFVELPTARFEDNYRTANYLDFITFMVVAPAARITTKHHKVELIPAIIRQYGYGSSKLPQLT